MSSAFYLLLLTTNITNNCYITFSYSKNLSNFSLIYLRNNESYLIQQLTQENCTSNISNTYYYMNYYIANTKITFWSKIQERLKINLYALNCSGPLNISQNYLDVYMKQGHDEKTFPLSFVFFIASFYFFILTVLWIINRRHHMKIKLLIHDIIYFCLYANLIDCLILSAINLIYMDEGLDFRRILIVSFVFILQNFVTMFLAQAFSAGLSTVYLNFSKSNWALIVITSFLWSFFQYLLEANIFEENMFMKVFCEVLFLISVGLYCFLYMLNSMSAIKNLRAHLLLIKEYGIIPESTPTYRKIQIFTLFKKFGTTIIILDLMFVFFSVNGLMPYWTSKLLLELSYCVLYGVICYKLRIRNAMASYGEDEDFYIVSDGNENKEWEPGMKLPPIPQGHRVYSQNNEDEDQ